MWADLDPPKASASAAAATGEWRDGLVAPVFTRIQASWRLAGGTFTSVPRAGIGGAIVIRVAQGFGSRRWQERGRVAVAVVEAANRWVHEPAGDRTLREAVQDHRGIQALRFARTLVHRDRDLLHRIVQRVAPASSGDHAVPEPVLFLRGAVAAGVLVGAVPDRCHDLLDQWATATGYAWADPAHNVTNRTAADDALAQLPDCAARDLLFGAAHPPHPVDRPAYSGWIPFAVPVATAPTGEIGAAMVSAIAGQGPLQAAARWVAGLGGKHLRGSLVQAAAHCVGAPTDLSLACAADVEWLHAASLLLDDIVDEAELRRGAPALHRLTTPAFAAGLAGWIIGGVFLRQPRLESTMFSLAEGQRAELVLGANPAARVHDWYEVAGAKTAALFSAAAACGGHAGGADAATIRALTRFGHELGLAFQLVDDILDITGTALQLGKYPGRDELSGRPSYVALARRESRPNGQVPADGLLDQCRLRANEHARRAISQLDRLDGDTSLLRALVARCVERTA